jgi:hypothetical protein
VRTATKTRTTTPKQRTGTEKIPATTKKMTTTPQTKKANLTATVHPIAKMTGTPIMEIATMSRNPIKASPQMKTTT